MPSISGAMSGAKLGAVAGPIGMAVGGVLGGILGGRKSALQKAAEKAGTSLIPQLSEDARQDRETADLYKNISLPALTNATQFYQAQLGPNSTEALNATLGPERQALTEGAHKGLITQLNEFAPRGGGRVAMGAQSLQELNKQLMDLVAKGRIQAAQGLLQSGTAAGGLAGQFAQLSANERQALAAFISDTINGGNRQRSQSGAFMGGLFKDIGGILADIFAGGGKGGKGGGGMTGIGDVWPEN